MQIKFRCCLLSANILKNKPGVPLGYISMKMFICCFVICSYVLVLCVLFYFILLSSLCSGLFAGLSLKRTYPINSVVRYFAALAKVRLANNKKLGLSSIRLYCSCLSTPYFLTERGHGVTRGRNRG